VATADLRQRYLDEGWWNDDTFGTFIDQRVAADPGLRIRVWSDLRPGTTTAGELAEQAARLAGGLAGRGLGPGDVIAYQMPNWIETLQVLWAGFRLGATMVPIIHFYGPREVEFILRQSRARALVTCMSFGPVHHLDNLASVRSAIDTLESVVIADGGAPATAVPGGCALGDLLDHDPVRRPVGVSPDTVAMVGYTSGTTADPKGVVHTHRSLLAEVRQLPP
jgi:acyl-CoA synthetase (AMP-forming)/AMP-acid ligase II